MIVRSLAYDGTCRREWSADVIKRSPGRIDLVGVFDSTVEHPELGRIDAGTFSYEIFWDDRWYNFFRFEYPKGHLRNHYINISMPPKFLDGRIDYVDLDIDVVVWPGKEPQVLDEDEFCENAVKFGYPTELQEKTLSTLKSLLSSDILTELLKETYDAG